MPKASGESRRKCLTEKRENENSVILYNYTVSLYRNKGESLTNEEIIYYYIHFINDSCWM